MTGKTSHRPSPFTGFILHLHPKKVPADTVRFSLSFGLGGMAATLFMILVCTGILQLLSYSGTVESAHQSIIHMYGDGSPAGFIRNIHYWAGNLLVIVSLLHLVRVYLTGATDRRRRVNWLIGVCLFLLLLFANFTGYLLPWDQLAFWAVTIFTNMIGYIPFIGIQLSELLRGGGEVGAATLSNFFAIHVAFIPACIIILLIFHFWFIRRAGGLIRSNDTPPNRVPAVPTLISREAAVGLGLTALLFLFAAVVDAPLAGIANPGESPNPAKAAWYFLGLQELLLHLHPTYAICIVPALMLGLFMLLPFINDTSLPPGSWCGGSRGRRLALSAFAAGLCAVFPLVVLDDRFMKTIDTAANMSWFGRGLLPLVMITLVYGLIYLFLRRKDRQKPESVMALVMITFGIIIGLTAVGIWFRGEGMVLTFPF